MGLKIGKTRCPGCGAIVPFGEGQRQARCGYCGSPVTIDDDDQVVRNVDEADLYVGCGVGRWRWVGLDVLCRIARALGVRVRDLIDF